MALRDLFRKNPESVVAKASSFAERTHAGQMRKNGEPYFSHVAGTAEILSEWHMDDATVAAGFLHDTVEDTGVPLETIKQEFGEEVAFLVDGVTKLGRLKYRGAGPPEQDFSPDPTYGANEARNADSREDGKAASSRTLRREPLVPATAGKPHPAVRDRKDSSSMVSQKAENMRKMIVALSQDLRVVFIKLADRLNNMHTLGALSSAKQKRIALETSEIYAPLAYRLGMYNVSGELEDIAFSYLFADEYHWLIGIARERYEKRLHYLESIKPEVETLLKKHDLKPIAIDFRAKRYSSLYKKLMRHGMDIEKIHDLVAMRIIVRTIPECYAVLGVIHEAWPPVPGRVKDYIALPKPNAYRSLHTTLIGPEQKIIEFQIRTREMHEESEYGVAAHWLYKQKRYGHAVSGKSLAQELTWIQQLKQWQEHLAYDKADPEEFMRAMKIDFFKDRIFAITPDGEVIDLPQGATPIDFAYHIHSEIGDSATGAKVNGTLVPLDHELRSGDMVEVIMQKGKKPSEDWLKFVKSSAAHDHIRAALRGRNTFAEKLKSTHCELKIVAQHRVALIKDISIVTAHNHMGILSFRTENPKGGRYVIYHAEIQSTDPAKIEKLILKIKVIPGVKEVGYKLV